MSTHAVNVVRVGEVLPHPNADRLEMVPVGGYTCLVQAGQFKPGDLAVFIEPDYVVPDSPEFSFVKRRRIGAVRLRGMWSEGLLIPAPSGAAPGDNVMDQLGITRYEPTPNSRVQTGGNPEHLMPQTDYIKRVPKYDLENLKKYTSVFTPGEMVSVTEKLHGTNARYVFHDGSMYVGSRSMWWRPEADNVYWKALAQNPWVEKFCMTHPDVVLWGEVYGDVQDMKYGAAQGEYRFAVFDMWKDGKFLRPSDLDFAAAVTHGMRLVPPVALMEFDMDKLLTLAEEDSCYGGVREGLVIKPLVERTDPTIGRVAAKLVSRRYLSR